MAAEGTQAQSLWIKYRQFTVNRLVARDLGAALLQKRLDAGSATNAVGPYDFSPAVIARVRARLAAGKEPN